MAIIEFLLVYLLIEFFIPIADKFCELVVTIINLGISKVSLRGAMLQSEINNKMRDGEDFTESKHTIGFQIFSEDSEEDEE